MLAATLVRPGHIEVQERPDLEPLPHEAILRVDAAGVCATDLALWSGQYPVPLPLVPGHEFVGHVVRTGAQADASWEGKRATAEINNGCRPLGRAGLCPLCQQGLDTHCADRTVTGIISHDGAFAQEVAVPALNLHAVPGDLSDDEAIFIEPLAAAIQTFEVSPLEPGDDVVVLGAGRLGSLIAGVAQHRGARVLAVARSAAKCTQTAEWLKVKTVQLDDPDALVEYIHSWSEGRGAAHVVEATGSGSAEVMALASRLVRPRGTIHLKSTPGDVPSAIPLTALVVNEIRLQGSRCGPFDQAIELLDKRPFPLAPLVEAEYGLHDTPTAFERARTASKVVVRCQEV